MSTLVVSDLHLGARSGIDLLRRPPVLEALLDGLEGVDALVLLGDVVELRDGPVGEALALARPVLERLGERLGDRTVTIVPGNHDHRLIAPWLERRRGTEDPLGPEQRLEPADASEAARAIARFLAPARVEVAYPGLWVADGVYATHGHYLDRHITVPAFEPLGLRAIERLQRRRGALPDGVDGYEAILAPVLALLHELAQTAPPPSPGARHGGPSARAYRVLTRGAGGRRSLRDRLVADVGFPVAVAGLNRLGLGPVRADVSGPELRRSSLRAMGEVVRRLDVGAGHVLFGHTHRTGPLARDAGSEWTAPSGARLHNCGSWVVERFLGGPAPQDSPYRAGGAVLLDGEPPRLLRLLDDPRLLSAPHPA